MTSRSGAPYQAGSTEHPVRTTVHTVTVDAPADDVYAIVADATRWPYTFDPTVHVEVLRTDAAGERLRLWAFANGDVRTWTSRRSLDPDARHVGFEQEIPAHPVRSMGGEWRIEELSADRSRVELLHHYTAATAEGEILIARAVEHNSTAELAALKRSAEQEAATDGPGVVLDFEDAVEIAAGPDAVYEFLRDGAAWPRRLPHVARLDLTEDVPDLQHMVMDTRTPDGSVHTTESVRVCLPEAWSIAYKQIVTPPLMQAHVGRWTITRTVGGVLATSRHVVVIRPERIVEMLGPDATLEQARGAIRARLGANSTTTLMHAKAFAEAQADPRPNPAAA
jgi:aromatase